VTGAAKAESVQLVLPASSGELALPTPAERVLAALPPLTAELATAETAGRAAAVAKRVAALITIAKAISQRGRFLNKIARLHIEAIAKAGELLAATVKRGGSKFRAGTLPTGVDKKHSHRWQAIARVPVLRRVRRGGRGDHDRWSAAHCQAPAEDAEDRDPGRGPAQGSHRAAPRSVPHCRR
jgi:hypothetical protein